MRHIRSLVTFMLCLFTLTGCACKHQWTDATCVTPKTCMLCEETEGEPAGHSWVDATCEFPKCCSACSATEGEPAGHSWVDATCEFPKHCSACSATEGQPLPHSEATRYGPIDYVTCSTQRQVYCSICDQTLSAEDVILDALHDGECFFFDSQSFLERYSAVAEKCGFESCDFIVIDEEITKDVLALEYNGGRVGNVRIAGGEDYRIRVRFTFYGLDESGGKDGLSRCTRIAVTLASSATVGDPYSDAPDPVTEEEEAILDEERAKVNAVMLNFMIWRNVCVTLMTCDPTLEAKFPETALQDLLLTLLDTDEDDTVVNNSAVHNNIHYYINENRELVIEVAP